MGRPSKKDALSQKVENGDVVDFSNYTQKQLVECIEELAKKVKEKNKALLSESELKSIKNALNSQIIKIDKAINPIEVVEPIAPIAAIEPQKPKDKKADKKKKEEAKDTTTEEKKDVNPEEEEAKETENAPTVKVAEPTAIAEEEKE